VTRPTGADIAAIPLFSRVAPADRDRLAAVSEMRSYERTAPLFDEGDPSDHLYVIVTGRVKVFKHGPSGNDVILEIFGPGGPLGAVATYEGQPFPASASAIDPTTCLLVPRRAFFELLERHPSLTRGLLSSLSLRLVQLTTRLAELTATRIDVRFARLFLKLADQLGRKERGGLFIPLRLTRQELADLTGTTIETAIRIMSRWGKDEVLLTEKDGFVLVNRGTLETLANE